MVSELEFLPPGIGFGHVMFDRNRSFRDSVEKSPHNYEANKNRQNFGFCRARRRKRRKIRKTRRTLNECAPPVRARAFYSRHAKALLILKWARTFNLKNSSTPAVSWLTMEKSLKREKNLYFQGVIKRTQDT
ncbi:MAG: hypothetical protein ABF791_02025 [Acetobacter sp.]|uniref:hypothetical protein n=1 Tax=Acetobacter sp. TaxID=440 RepID=UPI0039E965CF